MPALRVAFRVAVVFGSVRRFTPSQAVTFMMAPASTTCETATEASRATRTAQATGLRNRRGDGPRRERDGPAKESLLCEKASFSDRRGPIHHAIWPKVRGPNVPRRTSPIGESSVRRAPQAVVIA